MADRKPDLMRQKVDMRKVIDLSELGIKKLKSLFKKSGKWGRKAISRHIAFCHTAYGEQMMEAKKRKKKNRRNGIAKESRRRNR